MAMQPSQKESDTKFVWSWVFFLAFLYVIPACRFLEARKMELTGSLGVS